MEPQSAGRVPGARFVPLLGVPDQVLRRATAVFALATRGLCQRSTVRGLEQTDDGSRGGIGRQSATDAVRVWNSAGSATFARRHITNPRRNGRGLVTVPWEPHSLVRTVLFSTPGSVPLVEVVGMVIYVRAVPWLLPAR